MPRDPNTCPSVSQFGIARLHQAGSVIQPLQIHSTELHPQWSTDVPLHCWANNPPNIVEVDVRRKSGKRLEWIDRHYARTDTDHMASLLCHALTLMFQRTAADSGV